ncbi:putative Glycosyltransferase [Candidatus Terasakiella magnetica]|uniref:Putative Glycosyltransferase n=1 Tax=Candidatus Terasakiella magnetica TaxID=1867952 RepID=A0A1C3RLV9_9PROT|nr:glycosyltransferase family 4 protein [Candidatus Terasakiella magnetica]SCA58233.1 putative Glycosyltransferase [Candidatus Terasakiella magnetica]
MIDNTNSDTGQTPQNSSRLATVMQVLPAMVTGGVERGTVEMAEAIVKAGGRAIVVSAGGPMVHELTRVGAEHVEMNVESKNFFIIRKNATRLEKMIKQESVDLVHARSRAPAWSAYWASKRTHTPFITTFHGTYSHQNPMKRWYNSVMTKGERVIAISSFIAGHMRKIYGVRREIIRVIHRGVDLFRFDPEKVTAERLVKLSTQWNIPDGVPVVALPGRLTRWKGQLVFIDAIAKLERKDICCLLIGSDQGRSEYRKELVKRIKHHNLEGVITIVDECTDMPTAYMLSDIVVSASTDPEAFGRVVCEAQAMGRPVVATDHGGARETVIEDHTGWLCKPGDSETMSQAIAKGLNLSEEKREKMAGQAMKHIREGFSKDAMCSKTLEVYNEVLSLEN